jgi:hypothetical protein
MRNIFLVTRWLTPCYCRKLRQVGVIDPQVALRVIGKVTLDKRYFVRVHHNGKVVVISVGDLF